MNEKQVKKWLVISFVICFVLLMLPTLWSNVGMATREGYGGLVTIEGRTWDTIVASLVLAFLIFMIYSDNIISWFDKRGL